MGNRPFLTWEVRKVVHALLQAHNGELYGLELAKAAQLPSGSVYPILARLEQAGLIQSSWEDIDPRKEGRRPRRYYCLTSRGFKVAQNALTETCQFFELMPREKEA
jgi:PadR family transcriptional regulator PadR